MILMLICDHSATKAKADVSRRREGPREGVALADSQRVERNLVRELLSFHFHTSTGILL
jgi:hypothetical protein